MVKGAYGTTLYWVITDLGALDMMTPHVIMATAKFAYMRGYDITHCARVHTKYMMLPMTMTMTPKDRKFTAEVTVSKQLVFCRDHVGTTANTVGTVGTSGLEVI